MKQTSLILLAILFFMSVAFAQEEELGKGQVEIKVDPASKARIKFLEDYWDFGSIPLNAVVTHDFPIKNEGTDTLVITAVKPTCGCTTAPLESDRIAPGEVENLHVQLNTKKLNGLVNKFINIECNDPISPYLRISFRAVINDPRQIIIPIPNMADFGTVLKGEGKYLAVELRNGGDQKMNLELLDLPDENVIATEIGKKVLDVGESTELKFTLSENAPTGPMSTSISMEASGKPGTRISIPIAGTVVE
jgi:hypothetical protein